MTYPPSPPDSPDPELVAFLQRYASDPPPPAPDLELKIQSAVRADRSRQRRIRPQVWLPPLLAASVLMGWVGWRSLQPAASLSGDEQAQIEAFLENSWSGITPDPAGRNELNL